MGDFWEALSLWLWECGCVEGRLGNEDFAVAVFCCLYRATERKNKDPDYHEYHF